MTPLDRVLVARSALKVFPLPSAVLLPHSALPLHIFEPRYQDMVRDCLAGDGVIALGQLQPGWEEGYTGRPGLHPVLGVGTVVWHEELASGRYNIVLQGIARARMTEELEPTKTYREVRAEILDEREYAGQQESALRSALLELSGRLPLGTADNLLQAAAKMSGGGLADVVAGSVLTEVEERFSFLCEADPRVRLELALSRVTELIARLAPIHPGPPN